MWQSLDITGLTVKEETLENLFMRGVVVMRLAWLEVLLNCDITILTHEKPFFATMECFS